MPKQGKGLSTISQLERGRKNSTPRPPQFGSFPTPLTRPAATLSRSCERGKAALSPISRTHLIRPSATFSPSDGGKGIEAEREQQLCALRVPCRNRICVHLRHLRVRKSGGLRADC